MFPLSFPDLPALPLSDQVQGSKQPMSSHLIRQGQAWCVKVAITADVQQHFFDGKRAFKQTLKTSGKGVAIRSGNQGAPPVTTTAASQRSPEMAPYNDQEASHPRTGPGRRRDAPLSQI